MKPGDALKREKKKAHVKKANCSSYIFPGETSILIEEWSLNEDMSPKKRLLYTYMSYENARKYANALLELAEGK
jgi:hypothetical protein